MSYIKQIKNFNLQDFLIKNNLIENLHLTIKNIDYIVRIKKFLSPSSLQVDIFCKKSNHFKKIILGNSDLIWIIKTDKGSYHISISLKNLTEDGYIIISHPLVFRVNKRSIKRIILNKEIIFSFKNKKFTGLIENISPFGAKLATHIYLENTNILNLELNFKPTLINTLNCKIVWTKQISKNNYCYGLNFIFDDIKTHHELKKHLNSLQ